MRKSIEDMIADSYLSLKDKLGLELDNETLMEAACNAVEMKLEFFGTCNDGDCCRNDCDEDDYFDSDFE